MAGENEEKTVRTPTWQWTWNLNTIVILLGFMAGIATWGSTWERISSGQLRNDSSLLRLETRLTSVEASLRLIDNHELRLTGLKKQASDAAATMRTVEAAMNSLASDIRVTREIVQRIEAAQSRNLPP